MILLVQMIGNLEKNSTIDQIGLQSLKNELIELRKQEQQNFTKLVKNNIQND